LGNALKEAEKRDDSRRKYVITDYYCCRDAAGWGLAGRSRGRRFTVNQEETHTVQKH
jgi:hypothetical protein